MRNPRKTLLLLVGIPLAALAAWIALLSTSLGYGLHDAGAAGPQRHAARTMRAHADPAEAARQHLAPAGHADAAERSTLAAFWLYVDELRSLPDAAARKRALLAPASGLRELPAGRRSELQVRIEHVSDYLVAPDADGEGGIPRLAHQALVAGWVQLAAERGEDLCGAALELVLQECGAGVEVADPSLVELACLTINHFAPSDPHATRAAQTLLPVLHRIGSDAKPPREVVQPLLFVLVAFCFPEGRDELRREAVVLLGAPWLDAVTRTSFGVSLVAAGRYPEWRADVRALIDAAETSRQWAGVEMLRIFASRGEVPHAELADLLAGAARSPAATVQWAALELLATFGGTAGREALHGLLAAEDRKLRTAALSFLAQRGKVTVADCEPFVAATDQELVAAGIDALGHLAKADPAATARLRGLLAAADAEARTLVVRALGLAGGDVERDLAAALADPSSEVQLEAIRQLGARRDSTALLEEAARSPRLDATCRTHAFVELLVRTDDAGLPAIYRAMLADRDPQIRTDGYLGLAALAVSSGDRAALASWRELPIPEPIRERAGLAAALPGAVRNTIESEIERSVAAWSQPEVADSLVRHSSLFAGVSATSPLRSGMRVPHRIARYLRNQRQR